MIFRYQTIVLKAQTYGTPRNKIETEFFIVLGDDSTKLYFNIRHQKKNLPQDLEDLQAIMVASEVLNTMLVGGF